MTRRDMDWPDIPYVGSFQRGIVLRSGDPVKTAWKQIERIGTIDNLARIATTRKQDASLARLASQRMRQAIELRNASTGASSLTRPLLLYYSVLNLLRGALLVTTGSAGKKGHGLKFNPGNSLFDCTASVLSGGTFPTFIESLKLKKGVRWSSFTLSDVVASIPELLNDFRCASVGDSHLVRVKVLAMMDGDMFLRYHLPESQRSLFAKEWQNHLPWFADLCELVEEPFTLRVKKAPADENAIQQFCYKHLIHDLTYRQEAWWYDQWAKRADPLLPRIAAYLVALFVLSNVNRYEPELLEVHMRESTDIGYFITTFLDLAERFLPQLVLERVEGRQTFFE